jgi:hypothetical protein
MKPATPHVDVRAIVFSPENPDLTFIASDGGVIRSKSKEAVKLYCQKSAYIEHRTSNLSGNGSSWPGAALNIAENYP